MSPKYRVGEMVRVRRDYQADHYQDELRGAVGHVVEVSKGATKDRILVRLRAHTGTLWAFFSTDLEVPL